MLKKRVIFVLLYDRGTFMLSRNFRLQKAGNLRWLKENYDFSRIAFSIDPYSIPIGKSYPRLYYYAYD